MKQVKRIAVGMVGVLGLVACGTKTGASREAPAVRARPATGNGKSQSANGEHEKKPHTTEVDWRSSNLPEPPVDGGAKFASREDVVVTLDSWAVDQETGFLNVLGSVENKTPRPITGQVAFVYKDEAGKMIGTDGLSDAEFDSVPFSAPIMPGERGYFFRPRDIGKLSNGEVKSVEAHLWYAVLEEKTPKAVFSNVETAKGDYPSYKGTIRNSGDANCTSPAIEIAFLEAGKVVYLDNLPLDTDLAPSDLAEFSGETLGSNIGEAYSDIALGLTCGPSSFER